MAMRIGTSESAICFWLIFRLRLEKATRRSFQTFIPKALLQLKLRLIQPFHFRTQRDSSFGVTQKQSARLTRPLNAFRPCDRKSSYFDSSNGSYSKLLSNAMKMACSGLTSLRRNLSGKTIRSRYSRFREFGVTYPLTVTKSLSVAVRKITIT